MSKAEDVSHLPQRSERVLSMQDLARWLGRKTHRKMSNWATRKAVERSQVQQYRKRVPVIRCVEVRAVAVEDLHRVLAVMEAQEPEPEEGCGP